MEQGIKNLITEEELRELFGISKSGMYKLRVENKLPYLKITRNARLYAEEDIMNWLLGRKTILNKI